MSYIVENIPYAARVVDSYPYSVGGTRAQAELLKARGVDGLIGYLGAINKARLSYALEAGMGFMPVTRAGEYSDGAADELAELAGLAIPKGVCVWLDVEGLAAYHTMPAILISQLSSWARSIIGAGFVAGLYVGSPQPLTSEELYNLPFTRYWQGLGSCKDRFGNLAEPSCGWCMNQLYHAEKNGIVWKDTGVLVDANGVGRDYKKRAPVWMRET